MDMYRHIALYRLSDDADKKADLDAFCSIMKTLPEQEKSIVSIEIGAALDAPEPGGGLISYDVAQILTFRTKEDCLRWPDTPAHTDLRAFSSGMIELVGVIDYEIAE